MGYHSATKMYLFVEAEYFSLVRFLDNSHWELIYDRNDSRAIFSPKKQKKIIDYIIKS